VPWIGLAWRLLLFLAAGALLGWAAGNAVAGVFLFLIGVILLWSYQMYRVQKWLAEPGAPPPDVFGIWADIVSTIHRRQRRAAQEQERLQSTVDYLLESYASMRDGVVLVESTGSIRWCNQASREYLGLRYPDDMGQAITSLVRIPDFIDYFNQGSYEEPLQFAVDTADQRLYLQLIITRFSDGDRLLFVRDVSTVVRTEQIRRDFVGNVSHELRTPLTVITGYLGNFLLEKDRLPERQVRAIEQMAQQAERMENLLKDLLWLSRIEAREGAVRHDPVDVAALLEEVREEIGHGWPGRELRLELGTRERVYGDHRELHSCVSNLVVNALKYSADADPVTLSWTRHGDDLRLCVADCGIGIASDHIPRLTERFYRVDDSRSSASGGTGLGLAIVKHVAASHHARLEISSILGEGSRFTLVFPGSAEQSALQSAQQG
jgi:two-component system phosphate regulon sensor histidine kinase PhoR